MPKEHIYECEIRQWSDDLNTGKRKLQWIVVPVDEALRLGDVIRRCKECHGPIRLHNAGPGGVPRAHPEHQRRHPGCSLGDCFDGNTRLSPTPIEL
jgi:hypothetical protein